MFTPEFKNYIEASILGAARGAIGLVVEHPLDYVKTTLQASGAKNSIRSIMRSTYTKDGIKGFYAGVIPNTARVALKQAYRWPLMLGLPSFFQNNLFDKQDHPVLQKSLTGLTIASIESVIVTPLEKFKVWLMTNQNADKTLKNMLTSSNNPFKDLNIIYPRQIVAWGSLLSVDEALKNYARKKNNNQPLTFSNLTAISASVGVINTAAIMPLDTVKTLVQKHNPWPNQGVIKTVYSAYKAYGINGLYAGWQIRMTQYMLQALLTVNMLEQLERKLPQHTPKLND